MSGAEKVFLLLRVVVKAAARFCRNPVQVADKDKLSEGQMCFFTNKAIFNSDICSWSKKENGRYTEQRKQVPCTDKYTLMKIRNCPN